jgi:hypothetical protein
MRRQGIRESRKHPRSSPYGRIRAEMAGRTDGEPPDEAAGVKDRQREDDAAAPRILARNLRQDQATGHDETVRATWRPIAGASPDCLPQLRLSSL